MNSSYPAGGHLEFLNFLSRGNMVFVEAAFLVCLFWTALGRPERITSIGKFRLACSLFGMELIVPTLINLYQIGGGALSGTPAGRQQSLGLSMWLTTVGPLLLMASFLLAINSVMPPRKN
jgi:hypothetical protein